MTCRAERVYGVEMRVQTEKVDGHMVCFVSCIADV